MSRKSNIAIMLTCLLWPISASATTQEIIPGLVVVGWDRLSPANQADLRMLLFRVPRSLYQGLTEIHIDGEGFDPQAMNQINCYSGSSIGDVCAHELGHQIDVASPEHRHEWTRALIAEAGCDTMHYLRPIKACFFRDYPQEFIASMVGEWLLDSQPMLTRALDAFQTGNAHPLNQAVLLMALFGVRPTAGTWEGASLLAYSYTIPELWHVQPWRCGGPVTISGPVFEVELVLDANCRVMEVL